MNAINWFEIPVTDIARARAFYSRVLASELAVTNFGDIDMVMFPASMEDGVGGALKRSAGAAPSETGTLVYFAAQNFTGGLDGCLARAADAGGTVVVPRTAIGEHGFFGIIKDTEGNRVGLHAMT